MAQGDSGWRRERPYLFELVGVTAIAVAQPIFDVIQQAPEEVVRRSAGAREVVTFAFLVVVVPPLVLWLIEQLVRWVRPGWRDRVHGGLLGVMVGVFAVEVVKSLLGEGRQRGLWIVGIVVAVAAARLLIRSERARAVPRLLAVAAPVFLALFLFASPLADLVVGGRVEPADVEVADPVPVVLIAFDELPEISLLDGRGRIDAAAFPAFASLADDSTWFRNNTGVSPVTPSALPAILTGMLPTETFPAPVATRFPESLYTLLGGTYDVDAVEALTRLCPPAICEPPAPPSSPTVVRSLLSLGRDVFESVALPGSDSAELEFVIDETPADALAPQRLEEFAADVAAGEGSTLDVGHFLLPHQPWDFLASGRTYTAPDPPRSAEYGEWFDDVTAAAGRQRHLVQLQYTDALLGDALDQLRASGRYEESLVIVTADHGAAFTAGTSLRGLTEDNFAEIMWTPLFVKLPGQQEPVVDDRPTETIDIVPTVADVVGVDIPWDVDGTSVFEPADPDRPVRMYDWRFSEAPVNEDGYAVFDRQTGFDQVLAGRTPLTGNSDDPFALQRLGPFADLVGTDVDDYRAGAPVDTEVETASAPRFTVAADATDLPAYVEGNWSGGPDGWIAVSVDGTIAGMAQVYPQGGQSTFWALLAETVFTPGPHELALHTVEGSADDPVLHPLGMAPVPG